MLNPYFFPNMRLFQPGPDFILASVGPKQVTSSKPWIMSVKTLKVKEKFL